MSYRIRNLPDGEWGPWIPSAEAQFTLPILARSQAAAIGQLLHDFVEKARKDAEEHKRRMRIAWLELQLLHYEVGTHLYDETRKKMLDSARPGG